MFSIKAAVVLLIATIWISCAHSTYTNGSVSLTDQKHDIPIDMKPAVSSHRRIDESFQESLEKNYNSCMKELASLKSELNVIKSDLLTLSRSQRRLGLNLERAINIPN
uniref:Uncharacterized protein n=1 Tax=Glyptapanteles flavicoxis TaxID=463051 RepID=B7S888_9HYME|nr:hypothetical protein GFP_L7_0540 [Glyptapanteles flavicoxis]